MYEGCNKTALTSQSAIAEALLNLMKEKPYSKISVSEICKRAGVSRQTFYTLFES
jgi:AcrR family transcriptional regulator